jgi:hypothetical protein
MSFRDIESGITESPVGTDEMMLDLMAACIELSTAKSLSAHARVRKVLIGVWVVNIMFVVPIFVLSFTKKNQADVIGLGMVVIQLYVAKIIESLNKLYDKLTRIYSESEYIRMRLVEIFSACEEHRRNFPNAEIRFTAGKYIISLSRGILADIADCSKETKIINVIINSFMWKSPLYAKFLDRTFVNDKAIIIKSILNKSH